MASLLPRGEDVDANETPRRTWYRKKRTWAAAGLALLVWYPISFGPAAYAAGRGWIGGTTVEAAYAPVIAAVAPLMPPTPTQLDLRTGRLVDTTPPERPAVPLLTPAARGYAAYVDWCDERGRAAGRAEP